MKNILGIMICVSLTCFAGAGYAQIKDTVKVGQGIDRTAKKVGQATAKTAKKIGNGTASTASKLASKVTDKKYKGKVGPAGQTVYIDSHAKCYYVDEKGKKVYIAEADLKDEK